jgi:hypothetical protein
MAVPRKATINDKRNPPPKGRFQMRCKQCKSENVKTFTSEVALHFPGLDGLNKPIVWGFPKLQVCLDCGLTEFTIPQRELTVLKEGKPVKGAVVLMDRNRAASN